jgi:hypothetical protein
MLKDLEKISTMEVEKDPTEVIAIEFKIDEPAFVNSISFQCR